jgi:hypothetical protein
MSLRNGLCVFLAAIAGACGASSNTPATVEDPGAAAFNTACMGCHDQPDPPRPDLSGQLPTPLASKALYALIERQMPPRDSDSLATLDDSSRSMIVQWLCRRTHRSESVCSEMAADAVQPRLMRPPSAIVTAAKQITGVEASPEVSGLVTNARPHEVRDARSFANVLILGADVCTQQKATSGDECLKNVLSRGLATPAEVTK